MADVPPEKSLDDFFAKRDKKKKKEKGKGKESATGPTSAVIKKNKREKEKSAKNENQDAHIEKVSDVALQLFGTRLALIPASCQIWFSVSESPCYLSKVSSPPVEGRYVSLMCEGKLLAVS